MNHSFEQAKGTSTSTNMTPQLGGHELIDAHEAIDTLLGGLDHFVLYEKHMQAPQLLDITKRPTVFLTQLYNTIIDTLQTGQDPKVKTQTYMMQHNTQTTFGLSPSQPKKPIQSVNELNDECISSGMLGHVKSMCTAFNAAALEATNPVLRRIFADSIPNLIEMAFELYLYQNENGYYQVPQFSAADTRTLKNSYAQATNQIKH